MGVISGSAWYGGYASRCTHPCTHRSVGQREIQALEHVRPRFVQMVAHDQPHSDLVPVRAVIPHLERIVSKLRIANCSAVRVSEVSHALECSRNCRTKGRRRAGGTDSDILRIGLTHSHCGVTTNPACQKPNAWITGTTSVGHRSALF